MAEDILSPQYWKRRLQTAPKDGLHHSIFRCPLQTWLEIEARHKKVLAQHIQLGDCILDAGCGYGRLLRLMPEGWRGAYLGVDISPDFIKLALSEHAHHIVLGEGLPVRRFVVGDLGHMCKVVQIALENGKFPHHAPLLSPSEKLDEQVFDWAVMISIRPMVVRNLGLAIWKQMEAEIRKVARKLLFLEYDVNDQGSVE